MLDQVEGLVPIAEQAPRVGSTTVLSVSNIEIPKVLDLIATKQTQYYTLWGVYTAVQFAVANYGSSSNQLSGLVLAAILLGVWAFNIGHLGFVLQCSLQLNRLRFALMFALAGDRNAYEASLLIAFKDLEAKGRVWNFFRRDKRAIADPVADTLVHFFIDVCASVALVALRFNGEWLPKLWQ